MCGSKDSGFNSMIVRLKARVCRRRKKHFRRFNSMIVRLKGGWQRAVYDAYPGFNSMIVRLKVSFDAEGLARTVVSIL